jgi:hypothetical protein
MTGRTAVLDGLLAEVSRGFPQLLGKRESWDKWL